MNCENLQFNLSLYLDDSLSESERASIDSHLPICPLCRQKLSEYRDLRNSLRMMSNPEIPADLINRVRNSVSAEIQKPTILIDSKPEPSFREKIGHWFMPYTVGTVAACLFTLILFTTIFSTKNASELIVFNSEEPTKTTDLRGTYAKNGNLSDISIPADSPDYTNISIDGAAPKVNPTGALLALTKSLIRGKMKDEEVVIVADVFGDGLARIADVVEPPNNKNTMTEIEKAFQTDPAKAPFLPPKMEKDKDTVRVVLKIQIVDVDFEDPPAKNS